MHNDNETDEYQRGGQDSGGATTTEKRQGERDREREVLSVKVKRSGNNLHFKSWCIICIKFKNTL
jgi:hypothetical protein